MRISGTTKLLGVLGHPVEHSLSPLMHNAAIAHLGINYVYLPLLVPSEQLAQAIAGFEAMGLVGFSVTIPHKQAIMPLLTEVSELAQRVGAVNTVWWGDRGWVGTNTDVAGFVAPLHAMPRAWEETTAVVLGNGGAARAVVAGCDLLGCAQIVVVGRNTAKLEAFQQSWATASVASRLAIAPWEALPTLLPRATLLVNTTPVGMHPHIDVSPLTAEALALLPAGAIAYDLIYTPRPTQFLQLAQAQGAIALDGLEMLAQQGAIALHHWTGQPAPIDIMRQALMAHFTP
ncbi:MAG: shikimate dehydrogenase [Kaiparowitsia implicata GSE-PSE-MK54-09C]|jgi:shikimate dehydrogenase|nr:shikimate dehydrogenase [Kaiparowitsia implicata GSE-PSE-MK54-09C]